MKSTVIILITVFFSSTLFSQELPKDVNKTYKVAEHLKSKKKYKDAIIEYKEVLRSVEHIPSMISIADIDMYKIKPANYREAYKYYDMAISQLNYAISEADKNSQKKYLTNKRDELIPKRKKAKSYVDDFDKAKELKHDGEHLLDYN
jgi:tetratricopeptide (TPR) repeat protein